MAYVGKTPKFEGVTVSKSSSGASVPVAVSNTSNTASSQAVISATVAGSSADDAVYQAIVSGVTSWSWGVDNSASDDWVLAASATLGTTNALAVSTAGVMSVTGIAKSPNFVSAQTNTVSSAGTLTLTAASTRAQVITGSTTHTVVLPDATTLRIGWVFEINNNSTGNVTVNDASAGLVTTVLPGECLRVMTIAVSTAAGSWDVHKFIAKLMTITPPASAAVLTVAGGKTATISNTLTFTGTDGSSVAFGTGGTAAYVNGALGTPTVTSINKMAITQPATGSTLAVADGKTLTASNTLTLTGTDSSSVAFGAGGTVAYTANKLSAFAATTSAELRGVISDETGSGLAVFNDTPTLIAPILGAASATTLAVSADSNPVIGVTNSTATASSSTRILAARFNTDTDCTGGYFYACTNQANSTIGRIEAASNTTVSYTTSSDKRIKTPLSEFNGLDILRALAVGSFQWKDKPSDAGPRPLSDKEIERGSDGVEYGVLAQDAFAVFPNAVSVGTDALTEDGHLETPWAVDYSKFVPVLMDAVKRLAARIAELEAK